MYTVVIIYRHLIAENMVELEKITEGCYVIDGKATSFTKTIGRQKLLKFSLEFSLRLWLRMVLFNWLTSFNKLNVASKGVQGDDAVQT